MEGKVDAEILDGELMEVHGVKMTIKNISDYCMRNGVMVYEEYDKNDRRKRFYKMIIPVFTDGEIIPTSNYDYLVKKPVDCYHYVKKLLEDDKFRLNVANWVRTWITMEI